VTDRSASAPAALESAYDEHLNFDFFGLARSNFWNFGFWTPWTATHEGACLNLMDIVTRPLPRNAATVYDVGCGKGATTAYLADRFPRADVVGINISAPQIALARELVPEAEFALMDATELGVGDGRVDHVVSIEAAVHFDTRWDFFAEAFRILRPGGWLVMSDVLMEPWATLMPAGNRVAGPMAYRAALVDAGFERVSVVDVTNQTWEALATRIREHLDRDPDVDVATRRSAARWLTWTDRATRAYVLVAARKPRAAEPRFDTHGRE
jgi:MPBQ/MSBQ methyltransferase